MINLVKLSRIIFIFLVIYVIFGITYTLLPLLGIHTLGDHTFFQEWKINKSDAMFVSFLWPLLFFIAGAYGGIISLLILSICALLLLSFFIWLSYFIDKKLFSRNITQ